MKHTESLSIEVAAVPPLSDEEIVNIVDGLACLHDDFDQRWAEIRNIHGVHDRIGALAIRATRGNPNSDVRTDLIESNRYRRTVEMQIPPEYTAAYAHGFATVSQNRQRKAAG